ncbi:hypothetical protein [uncultured Prochlorococcus sp.]|uniref:hypothetical protein n=1 Tax=uncultured Prochlorococcus sp. TaxID=159733 RepID=UPI0025892705|nr:hypothetical protein [uncultured Prochlorococcus sp.]
MLLKDHLSEAFTKASLENNILLKENIIVKWVHRFGIDSLNDLLIHSPENKKNQHDEQNQKQISLIEEGHEEGNQEQVNLKFLKTSENLEETKCKLKNIETAIRNEILSNNQNSEKNIKYINKNQNLPLPDIRNLRKWINKNKKAS